MEVWNCWNIPFAASFGKSHIQFVFHEIKWALLRSGTWGSVVTKPTNFAYNKLKNQKPFGCAKKTSLQAYVEY